MEDLKSITRRYGRNMGGGPSVLYGIPWDDLETIASIRGEDAAMKLAALLQGDNVVKSGKKWVKIRATLDTVGIVSEKVGEMDGKSRKQKLKFWIAGLDLANLGLEAGALNRGWVWIFADPNRTEEYFQLGNNLYAAESDDGGESGTGDSVPGRAGIEYNYSCYGFTTAYKWIPASAANDPAQTAGIVADDSEDESGSGS